MDFLSIMDTFLSYAEGNTLTLIGLAVCLLLLFYRKPKLFYGTLFFGLLLSGLFYLVINLL
jgi:cytosine/uracil/thiamine/allantoin permease